MLCQAVRSAAATKQCPVGVCCITSVCVALAMYPFLPCGGVALCGTLLCRACVVWSKCQALWSPTASPALPVVAARAEIPMLASIISVNHVRRAMAYAVVMTAVHYMVRGRSAPEFSPRADGCPANGCPLMGTAFDAARSTSLRHSAGCEERERMYTMHARRASVCRAAGAASRQCC